MGLGAIFAAEALLPEGWAEDVLIELGSRGEIAAVKLGQAPGAAFRAAGPVIPGMPNLHSHAFQRAMAGLTEQTGTEEGAGDDSFWTWRKLMYGFVGRLRPEQVEAIAGQLYVEMLKSGYTAVAEFHYLHHDPDGAPYGDLAEMSERVIAAAKATGIGLTMLPVLYGAGGFGGKPATAGQRRFLNDPQRFLELIGILRQRHGADPQIRIGIAPHSLRAATPEMLGAAVAGLRAQDPTAPIHIHIAEQTKEVEDCLAWSGQRPVEWLLAHQPVDQHWCLVHATHMTERETHDLAASGAVAGLCPTTEANLGDGFFPAEAFFAAQRPLRHRLRQPYLRQPDRGAALARIRPAPRHPAAQCAAAPRRQRTQSIRRACGGGALSRGARGRRPGRGPSPGPDRRRARGPISWSSTRKPRCCWAAAAIRCWMPWSSPAIRTRCATSSSAGASWWRRGVTSPSMTCWPASARP